MTRRLFWKLCLIIATGVVAFFYCLNLVALKTEEEMSMLALDDREQIKAWGKQAEHLYNTGDLAAVELWLAELQAKENTWASIASYQFSRVAGGQLQDKYPERLYLGRSVDWKIHLYFTENPIMAVPFVQGRKSFLIQLPDSMRPGSYWQTVRIFLQIIIPMLLLGLLSWILYRHIMNPLRELELATREFTKGNFDIRVRKTIGKRNDEITELAATFDRMAERIGDLIISQRQLIADLSHELRTPLTRLDIAVQTIQSEQNVAQNLARVERESSLIRKLVDDTLTLAWLENERPSLTNESLDLVDLIDVITEDARFEYPDKNLKLVTPNSAILQKSSHRALGQAIENILRNALRYTAIEGTVEVILRQQEQHFCLLINDQGPGVPEPLLESIFLPFFRVDKSRCHDPNSFGLGLALAKRQLSAVGASVHAMNRAAGGLAMRIIIPK
ncbi:two-component sensor histidine kinase [Saccharobesus litoralis]|uniref:histidine kinase n=2 Tax=Saccharobesus litoralis TaxID=2172099 RepID=A0A2S0VXJ4_9ALTE|nr:two-component sensor histidine kinase [Saccharobesus litoralis]